MNNPDSFDIRALSDKQQMLYTIMYALESIEEDIQEGTQPNLKLVQRAMKMTNTLIKINKNNKWNL